MTALDSIITLDVMKKGVNRFKNLQKIQKQNFLMNIWIILSQILSLKKKIRSNPVLRRHIGTVLRYSKMRLHINRLG